MIKRLELLIASSLLFSGCSISIQDSNEYLQYIKNESERSDYQRADKQCESIIISPLIILKFDKEVKDKKCKHYND